MRHAEGPAGAPTLLLLHGWTASADLNWFPEYGPLAERWSVLAIDHRGHGRGIRSDDRFRLADCADDAAAACAELGIDRVIAVGYSMGGAIAQLLWHRHRDLVAGLVFCATSRKSAAYGPAQTLETTAAASGRFCSSGFRKGPRACSASALPSRSPVARPSQKLPPENTVFPSAVRVARLGAAA